MRRFVYPRRPLGKQHGLTPEKLSGNSSVPGASCVDSKGKRPQEAVHIACSGGEQGLANRGAEQTPLLEKWLAEEVLGVTTKAVGLPKFTCFGAL